MLANPMDVLSQFPVRKSRAQKQAFLDAVQSYMHQQGYVCCVERGHFGCRNLVIGDPESAHYLLTAHYDTCARMLLPNFITPCNLMAFMGYQLLLVLLILVPAFALGVAGGLLLRSSLAAGILCYFLVCVNLLLMLIGPANQQNANDNTSGVVTLLEIARSLPENQRSKVCFVLFDLEEVGLIGSVSYRKKHRKASDKQLVLNLDCVGDGDEILLFPTKYLKKSRARMKSLYQCCGYFGKKSILVKDKGFSIYPSDQMSFPHGVGIAALKRGKWGLYLDRIHTGKDTVLEETNVNILRAAIISLICCGAVKKG